MISGSSTTGPDTGVLATVWGREDVRDPGTRATVPPALCRAKLPPRAAPAISIHSVPPSPGPPGNLGTPPDRQVEARLPALPEHCHLGVSLDKVTNNPSPALPECNVFAISQVSRCSSCQTRAPGLASVSRTLQTHVTTSLPIQSPSPKAASSLREDQPSPTLKSLAPRSRATRSARLPGALCKGPTVPLIRKEKTNS